MNEERVIDAGETQEPGAGAEHEIVSELGTVTKRTQGSWMGFFLDGGIPPFNRELMPY